MIFARKARSFIRKKAEQLLSFVKFKHTFDIVAKKNIFLDHGGTPQAHAELLSSIKKLGYKTKMIYVRCDVNVALKRAVEREKITHRHTPPQMIIDRAELIARLVPQYKGIVDEFIEL